MGLIRIKTISFVESIPAWLFYCLMIVFFQTSSACNSVSNPENSNLSDSAHYKSLITDAPVYTAEESMKRMKIEQGFEIRLVAAEPLVVAPVAMIFDRQNRLWVVEMTAYMPDTLGTGEEKPSGKIVILSDSDKDGTMDKRTVFMDSLIMPRSICFIEDGILIAEPPNLWFVKIKDDKPASKILVDPEYAIGGNVEHQPNTLYRALDNWIYNGESTRRYRLSKGRWLIEETIMRGQWGISQDDHGRLFYNNNSQNLLGDYYPPSFGSANINLRQRPGFNERIVSDNRVYPSRPTPGVNRGYMDNFLDDSLRLVNFTAASGPVIYRGALFGKSYNGNAFVAEPSANLIKRNILAEKGDAVTGFQAYEGREFLASTDERFRPVTLYNGPDGALYITDMYRGIIQHVTYLTPYLKEQIANRELSQPLNCGRIYKIVPQRSSYSPFVFPNDPASLVNLLSHKNGWIRDKAQQILIDDKDSKAVPLLRNLIKKPTNHLSLIHALWTLEGFDQLQLSDLKNLVLDDSPEIRRQAVTLLALVANKGNSSEIFSILDRLAQQDDQISNPYIAFVSKYLYSFDEQRAEALIFRLIEKDKLDPKLSAAVIDIYAGKENLLSEKLEKRFIDTSMVIKKQINAVLKNMEGRNQKAQQEKLKSVYPRGVELFSTICQSCHGADGNGIATVAPPLNNSEWVVGKKENLIAITLFGLSGQIHVGGKLYKDNEFGDMPGIGSNKQLNDKDIAELLSFIRNSWSNKASEIKVDDILNIRNKYPERNEPFTEKELQNPF